MGGKASILCSAPFHALGRSRRPPLFPLQSCCPHTFAGPRAFSRPPGLSGLLGQDVAGGDDGLSSLSSPFPPPVPLFSMHAPAGPGAPHTSLSLSLRLWQCPGPTARHCDCLVPASPALTPRARPSSLAPCMDPPPRSLGLTSESASSLRLDLSARTTGS